MKPLISVHVVHYSCSNCGEEIEEVKMCKECSAPMRVIQVAELYGEEAEEYLETLKENSKKNLPKEKSPVIQFDEDIEIEEEEEGLSDDVELGEIFPEDDSLPNKTYVDDLGDDFEAALDILDQEDEDFSDDIDDLPEL